MGTVFGDLKSNNVTFTTITLFAEYDMLDGNGLSLLF